MEDFVKTPRPHEREILQCYLDRCWILHVFATVTVLLTLTATACAPILTDLLLPIMAYYPFTLDPNFAIFYMVYIHQIITCLQLGTGLVLIDCQMAVLMWYASARLEILAGEFRTVTNVREFRHIIQKHQRLLAYAVAVSDTMSYIVLVTMVSSGLGIIMCSIQIVSVSKTPTCIIPIPNLPSIRTFTTYRYTMTSTFTFPIFLVVPTTERISIDAFRGGGNYGATETVQGKLIFFGCFIREKHNLQRKKTNVRDITGKTLIVELGSIKNQRSIRICSSSKDYISKLKTTSKYVKFDMYFNNPRIFVYVSWKTHIAKYCIDYNRCQLLLECRWPTVRETALPATLRAAHSYKRICATSIFVSVTRSRSRRCEWSRGSSVENQYEVYLTYLNHLQINQPFYTKMKYGPAILMFMMNLFICAWPAENLLRVVSWELIIPNSNKKKHLSNRTIP